MPAHHRLNRFGKTRLVACLVGLVFLIQFFGCRDSIERSNAAEAQTPFMVVLGIAQDAGYPQASCHKPCCKLAWEDPAKRRFATSLAIVDPETKERWLLDATPDIKDQLRMLDELMPPSDMPGLNGIFLTHGHIGHYTGLMHLGHEVIGAKGVPVYAMPRMFDYLSSDGPWDQLARFKNIVLHAIDDQTPIQLNSKITVVSFLVPHRDEYTETVGYKISGPNRAILFIPDIDKWERWDEWGARIEAMFAEVDLAFVDGTFYQDGEVPGRNMDEIKHPFIFESMARFKNLPESEKAKVHFIHLNHTNPALIEDSRAQKEIEANGFRVAQQGETFSF